MPLRLLVGALFALLMFPVVAFSQTKGVTFDWTINIGHIGTIVVAFITILTVFNKLKWRVELMETHLEKMDKSLESIASILRNQDVQREQIIGLQRQIDEMKHGEGFVLPFGRSAFEVPPKG